MVELGDKDILQINATIIAGALVFLTISTVVTGRAELINRLGAITLGLGVTFLFGLSSMFVVGGRREAGLSTMHNAFKYLVVMVFLQLALMVWKIFQEVQLAVSNLYNQLV